MKKLILTILCIVSGIILLVLIASFCYNRFYYQPQQLYNAISNNNYESLKSLVNSGMDINKYEYNITNSENAFDEAFHLNSTSMAKLLVANGIDIDNKLFTGHNALFSATYMSDIQLCEMIINKGVNVYDVDENNLTVLDHAILDCNNTMIDYYLKNWFSLSSNNITVSLSRDENGTGELTNIDSLQTTRKLLEKCNMENIDPGINPLFTNAFLGNSEGVIELCTEENINNLSTTDTHYLSYVCSAFCNKDTLRKLEKYNIDITFFNNYYIDPLRCAAAYQNIDVVKYLIKKYEDISIRRSEKKVNNKTIIDITPLDYAIKTQNTELYNIFTDKGCSISTDTLAMYPNVYNKDILEPMSINIANTNDATIEKYINECVYNNNAIALETLLNNTKKSVLIGMLAGGESSSKLSKEIITLLTKFDITINYESMLINAIKRHDMYMVKYAVSNLKSLDFGDSEDTIPIAVAIKCGNMNIFDYLVDNCASLDIDYSINKSIRNLATDTNYSKEVKNHIRKVTIKKEGFLGWY